MIHAFNFTGSRDQALSDLMRETIMKYGYYFSGAGMRNQMVVSVEASNMDGTGYGNGAGWEASLMKLEALERIVKRPAVKDEDWILSVDSDVVFCNNEVFQFIHFLDGLSKHKFGITGIHQVGDLAKCAMGDLHNFSGCAIFMKAHIARRIVGWSTADYDAIRQQFKDFVLTENEDILLSYLAQYVNAEPMALPNFLFHSERGFEHDLNEKSLNSFYHLNYPTEIFKDGKFLDEPITGKWDIPGVLDIKGIRL